MKLRFLFFGVVADIVGERKLDMEVQDGISSNALRPLLEIQFPELKKMNTYVLAVNQNYVDEEKPLHENDEVAIIPPVSGG